MKHNVRVWSLAVVLGFTLAACAREKPPEDSVIGAPLQQALDRAESVQDTLDAQAAEMRRRIEEAEAGN